MGKADFTVPVEVILVQSNITWLSYVVKLVLQEYLAYKIDFTGFDSI
jgi:hypothetical protein